MTSKDRLNRLDLEVERYQRKNETLGRFVSQIDTMEISDDGEV